MEGSRKNNVYKKYGETHLKKKHHQDTKKRKEKSKESSERERKEKNKRIVWENFEILDEEGFLCVYI